MQSLAPRCLLTVFLLCSSACREQILHDLDELRANQVQLLLLNASIDAKKVRSGKQWSVAVDSSRVPAALLAIERSRILRRDLEHAAEQQGGFLQSSDERLRLYERQLASRIEQTLEQIPGVLEARVHLHKGTEADNLLGPAKSGNSASVLLVLGKQSSIEISEIRALVAGAAGIKPEEVSVLFRELPEKNPEAEAAANAGASSVTAGHLRTLPVWICAAAGSAAALLLAIIFAGLSRRRRRARLVPNRSPLESTFSNEDGEADTRFRNPFAFADSSDEAQESI